MFSALAYSSHFKIMMIMNRIPKFTNMKSLIPAGFLILFGAMLIQGCTSESTSLFDPDYTPDRPDPSISVIEPQDGWLAGVDEVTIRGENFSEVADENRVYFDGIPGIVHSSTTSEMVVRPARVISENVDVKLSVRRAINFSNELEYRLDQAVFQAPGSIPNDNALAITTNAEGNIIFGYQEGGAPRGIRKWNVEEGTVERILPSQFNWTSLKVGPDGLLYGARNIFGIYRETPDGQIDSNPFGIGNSGENYVDMDFDEDGYLWTVGDNDFVFRVDISDGSVTRFPFEANLRSVRYYDGKLYLGGRIPDGSETGSLEVWTMDINNGQATNPQRYLNISDVSDADFNMLAITFDVNGRMYMGANTGTGIYTWSEAEGFREFYPGLIEPNGYSFAWDGEFLIASATNRDEETRFALRIDTRTQGAPYFGVE